MSQEVLYDSETKEEYLQISANIMETFPSRIPVGLHVHSHELNRVAPFLEAQVRLSPKKKEQVDQFCEEGNLFVARSDYEKFAEHMSKNLGALLTSHFLDESDAANIFHRGLSETLREFFVNPTNHFLEPLKKDLAIFGEYVWADQNRWVHFFNALDRSNDLVSHSVNTLFVGIAVFLKSGLAGDKPLHLAELSLGLVLHDLGMTQLPPALVSKKAPFIYREKTRMKEHVEMGVKMLNRMDVKSDLVRACLNDHHERLDGSGYPRGARTDTIAAAAKICSVADAFCAMISERSFRPPLNPILAALILTESKKHYDPTLSNTLMDFIVAENEEMQSLFKDETKMQQLKTLAMKKVA